jgi:methyl-accepting chemotaxis protein
MKAQNWTIGRKLYSGIGVLLLLIAVSGAVGAWSARGLYARLEEAVGPVAERIKRADRAQLLANRLYRYGREIISTGFRKDVAAAAAIGKECAAEVAELDREIEVLEKAEGSAEGRRNTAGLRAAVSKWNDAFGRIQALSAEGKLVEADAVNNQEFRRATREIENYANALADRQYAYLQESAKQAQQSDTASAVASIGAVGLAMLAGLMMAWQVRGIVRTLRATVEDLFAGAEQTSSAAAQVATLGQALAQGASEQAAALEETSASGEEVNSMTRNNAQNSHVAAELAGQSQEQFAAANRSLDELLVAMSEIDQQSGKISQIIKVIDEVAFQTNILALNAAVEAARAGEAGMGFAVVADEVRNLAQRCAQAAKDTASLIEESISKSSAGKTKVEQMAVLLHRVTEDSGKIRTLIDQMNQGSQEQSRGVGEIGKAVSQIEQVTQRTAASAEESAAAAEELNAQAETLNATVGRLTAMVGGGDSMALSGPRPGAARPGTPGGR